MLDDILDYVENIRDRPVWQPLPDEVRAHFHGDVPEAPAELGAVYQEFLRDILPFAAGNVHPGFMGWVHGGDARRHTGGDAGGGVKRQSGWPRPRTD